MTHSMFDRELAREILLQIVQSIDKIERRFWPVDSIADLTDTDRGQERLDAICMKLIAIGESLKNLDKTTHGNLLSLYPEVQWKKAMAMRDVITHHYFDLDAEIVFSVCGKEIPDMKPIIRKMIEELA